MMECHVCRLDYTLLIGFSPTLAAFIAFALLAALHADGIHFMEGTSTQSQQGAQERAPK